jgi:hypothetical protein
VEREKEVEEVDTHGGNISRTRVAIKGMAGMMIVTIRVMMHHPPLLEHPCSGSWSRWKEEGTHPTKI